MYNGAGALMAGRLERRSIAVPGETSVPAGSLQVSACLGKRVCRAGPKAETGVNIWELW